MRVGSAVLLAITLLALPARSPARADPVLPPGFAVDDAAPGAALLVPTGMAFLPDGRFLVSEKRGRVYEVRGGIRQPDPLWSRESEVLDQHDRGLLGIAVDPNYFVNHYIYLYYTVDPDSDGDDLNDRAFNRLTRYQVGFTDSSVVDTSTRTVLLGVDWPSAPVSASTSHIGGCLRWGTDGSLLVSVGDGAEFTFPDAGGNDPGQFGPGLSDPSQDIGAYRAQDITGLNGKILRLNPADGRGYASNPYFDGDLDSPRSKVWCYGFRNPFRFAVRPGSGSTDSAAGQPGHLFIGDVGWDTFEELDVARVAGLNFGWPCYEGPTFNSPYVPYPPAHNGCDSFGSATNPEEPTPPFASWNHLDPTQSDPPSFIGNCVIAGAFYTGNRYPPSYQGQFFFSDYGQDWIKVAVVDSADQRLKLLDFAPSADLPVDYAVHPITGDLYYVSIIRQQIRRIRYAGAVDGNLPPVAHMGAAPLSGEAPLEVSFTADGSTDPEGGPLTYHWLFGDGGSADGLVVGHVYQSFGVMPVQLIVTDDHGNEDVSTVEINVTPSSGGFPATNVLDDFDRLDGPVGPPWVDQVAGLMVANGALVSTATYNSTVWNGGVFGSNQEAFVTLSVPVELGTESLMLKVQDSTSAASHIEVRYEPGAGRVVVSTYAPGEGGFARGLFFAQFSAGDRFGARVDSLGLVRVFRNSTLIGQVSVADWQFATAGGRIGLTAIGLNGGGVLDDFGGGTAVPSSNTRPIARIVGPRAGSTYYAGQTVDLVGSGLDAESLPDLLHYGWTVDLYHNNHIHPSVYTFTGPHAAFTAANHDDGTGVHLLVKLVVTDPEGLPSDTAYAAIWPEIDLRADPVRTDPESPTATESALYTMVIHNDGRMPAPISHWSLTANDIVLARGDTVIRALDSLRAVVKTGLPHAGFWTIRLVADSAGVVHETDETNNSSVRSLAVIRNTTGVSDALPSRLELSLPAPNPSRAEVHLALALPRPAEVEFQVLDLQGRVVHSEARRRFAAGRWTLVWDGRVAGAAGPPGLYLARVRVGATAMTRRIALLR